MSKFLVIFLILILTSSLVGCNLPNSSEIDPNIIATQVSTLLTSPTENLPLSNEDPPTIEVATITVVPSEISATETNEPTIEPTNEPTPSATNSLMTRPTGTPYWEDPFENGTRFGINPEGYDDGQTRFIISDGSMVLTSITASGWRGWRLTSQKPVNYFLQADFGIEECTGSDQYGLVIQSPDYDTGSGYYFGLTCDGRYAFQKWEENGLINLVGWDTNSNINAGSNQSNTLSILKSGNQYKLFVNDVEISSIVDEKFSSPGFFGPFIAGVNTANFSVRLTNISYWNLP
jgi:hypothetical protein